MSQPAQRRQAVETFFAAEQRFGLGQRFRAAQALQCGVERGAAPSPIRLSMQR